MPRRFKRRGSLCLPGVHPAGELSLCARWWDDVTFAYCWEACDCTDCIRRALMEGGTSDLPAVIREWKTSARTDRRREAIKKKMVESATTERGFGDIVFSATCGFCGGEITDARDAQLDHLLPVELGGDTRSENVQLVHAHCNREKRSYLYIDGERVATTLGNIARFLEAM